MTQCVNNMNWWHGPVAGWQAEAVDYYVSDVRRRVIVLEGKVRELERLVEKLSRRLEALEPRGVYR